MSETVKETQEQVPGNRKPSILKFITQPTEQFYVMKENPKVLIPLLLVTVVYAVWAAVFTFLSDFEILMGGASVDEAALLEGMESFIRMSTLITTLFVPIVGALIGALIMWIAVKLTAGDATYKQMFSLNVFIMLIGGIGLVLNVLLTTLFNLNPAQMITGLTVFFDPFEPIYALVSLFEVFSIWAIILTVMGLRIVASMKPATAWIVTLIITVGGAFISFLTAGAGM